MEILVTGPTGKVGRRLIRQLERRGVTVRTAGRASGFDWTDESTYAAARRSADAAFLVTGAIPLPSHAGYVRSLLDGADFSRVVLLSAYGVDQAPPDSPLRAIELAVSASGLPHTILRPGAFMQNFSEPHFTGALASIRAHDEFAMPGGDGLVSWVSTEDIAAVAVVALTEEGHEGRGYAPMGPQALTMAQVAAQISTAAGRRIRYVETDHEPLRAALLAAGAPPATADHNSRLYEAAMTTGAFAATNDDILRVTGAPPATFTEFTAEAAGAWRR